MVTGALDRIKGGRTDVVFDYLSEGHPAEAQDKASIPWAFRLTPPLVDSDDLLSQPTSPGRTALPGLWEY